MGTKVEGRLQPFGVTQPLHLVKWRMAYPFMGVPPHELVDGQDDLAQLGPRDTAVPVDVVQLEGPP